MNMNVQEHTYSDALCNTRIGIVGPLPPPLGGVAVHVERTFDKLVRQGNNVVHYDAEQIYPYGWLRTRGVKYLAYIMYILKFAYWLIHNRPRVVIYHLFYARNVLPELLLLWLFKSMFGSMVILVEHDCRHIYTRTMRWRRWYSWLLHSVDQLVLIGSVTALSYSQQKITMPQATTVESAFLPPDLQQQQKLIEQYPQQLFDFLSQHSPTILVSAFECVLWQGNDLYGLDQTITACAQLQALYPRLGLVLVLGRIGNQMLYERLCAQIEQYQLQDHFYLLQGNYILWPLFTSVDIFVRPTLSDGASVSVQEALFCGVTTIASDVCWRPAGTIVYTTADSADLCRKIQQSIEKKGFWYADQQHHYMHSQ